MARDDTAWWVDAVIYQVYPRSFQDSDGDGVGDLEGIRRRLDHVVALGADAIWISPVYPSPMADFGYDVRDYCGIDPIFGTLEDFDRLLADAHGRGLRVLMDLVPSHTSEAHPWFQEARSARDDPRRDWYVWRDPAPDGGPPNNWISEFGGPAWSFDEATGQYYLHIYLPQQPALNWRKSEVRAALHDAMRFWFDRGVDGFRIDAVEHLAPDPELRDNPPNPDWVPAMGQARSLLGTWTQHQPDTFVFAAEMRRVAREYPEEKLLVGEAYGTIEQVMWYYGHALDGFQLPFNFLLIAAEWSADNVAGIVDRYEAALPAGAWPNWVLGNHDRTRLATRIGARQARVAAMLLMTLRGTPTIYQGEELGMENVPIPPDRVVDPWEIRVPGGGFGRDPVRTPMAWTTAPGAGFTEAEPWLPIDARPQMSVAVQDGAAGSMLTLYRALLALRRDEAALRRGSYATLAVGDGVFCYAREADGRRLVVALNFTGEVRPLPVTGETLVSTVPEGAGDAQWLAPDEGRVMLA